MFRRGHVPESKFYGESMGNEWCRTGCESATQYIKGNDTVSETGRNNGIFDLYIFTGGERAGNGFPVGAGSGAGAGRASEI